MRVSKEKSTQNRTALLEAAGRLFRRHGIDGVGVAEVAREAGLTHGALYAHFPSKDALAAAAFAHGFDDNWAPIRQWAEGHRPSFEEYLDGMLSARARDLLEGGCPLTASASEIARQSAAVKQSFADAFATMVAALEDSLEDTVGPPRRRSLALAAVAAQVGAVAVSRAVAEIDPALADDVLAAVSTALRASHHRETGA